MHRYYNPNPKNNAANDCVVRVLCKVFNMDWDTAYGLLCEEGLRLKEIPTTNYVWEKILEDAGMTRVFMRCATNCPTVAQFLMKNQNGVFVLCSGTHVVACKDGDYFDTWDSGDVRIQYYYC